jgi:hypothetical protein
MAKSKIAKTPQMQSFARLIAEPGRFRETIFELPSQAIRVGDPITSHSGRVDIGVASASIFPLPRLDFQRKVHNAGFI